MKSIYHFSFSQWKWKSVPEFRPVTLQFLYDFQRHKFKMSWYHISKNEGIEMEDIENNPTLPWNYQQVLFNPNLTFEFFQQNLHHFVEKPMDLFLQTCSFTSEQILSLKRYRLREDDMNDIPMYWNLYDYSKNPNVTMELLHQKRDKKFDWFELSKNKSITMEMIDENLDSEMPFSWNFEGISMNPNLTIDFIDKYLDKFENYWKLIGQNSFLT
jgi:hypothetical protein